MYDATTVLESRDSSDAFHYIDPSYIGSDQGHYEGFSQDHYRRLLETRKVLRGKFLQSSYWSPLLEQYVNENGWQVRRFERPISASLKKDRRKAEVLVSNYPWGWLVQETIIKSGFATNQPKWIFQCGCECPVNIYLFMSSYLLERAIAILLGKFEE